MRGGLELTIRDILLQDEIWLKSFKRSEGKYGEESVEYTTLLTLFSDHQNRVEVVDELINGTYKWSAPEKVQIAKAGTTKKRVVYMYNYVDRFLQAILFRGLSKYYEHMIIDNCFSYRKGVTTLNAIDYIKEHKTDEQMYGLKLDISNYFNSVSKSYLAHIFATVFKEEEIQGIKKVLEDMYFNDSVTIHGKVCKEYKSLIAGSPMGSFFANICLSHIDKVFSEKKDVIYARYSDDIIIMAQTQEELEKARTYISLELDLIGLSINPKKYVHFDKDEPVEYLGLQLGKDYIDISEHMKSKMKKLIKRWVKKERVKIEKGESTFGKSASNVIKRYNHRIFKTYVINPDRYGWAYYTFRFITTYKSLAEIDIYFMNQLRYLKTGKHNKANGKALNEEDYYNFGFISLVDMYKLFKEDYDYYVEVAYRL